MVPEGDIFPAVDEDVDRAVEDQEAVGDVSDDGAPDWPLPLPHPPPHRPGHLQYSTVQYSTGKCIDMNIRNIIT